MSKLNNQNLAAKASMRRLRYGYTVGTSKRIYSDVDNCLRAIREALRENGMVVIRKVERP